MCYGTPTNTTGMANNNKRRAFRYAIMAACAVAFILFAVTFFYGCTEIQWLLRNTEVKDATIVQVTPIFEVNEWIILYFKDGTSMQFLGLWTEEYYIGQPVTILYHKVANPIDPTLQKVNVILDITLR